jgi:hypothetical protein
MDIPAPAAGTVGEILVQVGDTVSTGTPILMLQNGAGAEPERADGAPAEPSEEPQDPPGEEEAPAAAPPRPSAEKDGERDPLVVIGSGPGGYAAAFRAADLGVKTILNEFIAYQQLGELVREGALAPRSAVIASYALCGFANFGSLAILLGGLTGLAPTRRAEVARLGLRSILAGSLATFMTACVAGLLL